MATRNRVFGQNMSYYMDERKISPETLAEKLGYSKEEVIRAMDSRLFLDGDEKRQISEALGVPLIDLTSDRQLIEKVDNGSIEYRGKFSDSNNRDLILNLFDAYCDIQELLV